LKLADRIRPPFSLLTCPLIGAVPNLHLVNIHELASFTLTTIPLFSAASARLSFTFNYADSNTGFNDLSFVVSLPPSVDSATGIALVEVYAAD